MKTVIIVAGECHRFQIGRIDGQVDLLAQLANQRSLWRFAGFEFSTGKFPKARHCLAGRALGDEDAALGVEQRRGRDNKQRHLEAAARRPSVLLRCDSRR